jgi:phage gpG-like protein
LVKRIKLLSNQNLLKNNSKEFFADLKKRLEKILSDIPEDVATIAEDHFLESYHNEGFTDKKLTKWRERKNDDGRGRRLLVKSGDLRRSVEAEVVSKEHVRITANTPYAERHNEGLGGMPERKFIGESEALNEKIKEHIQEEILKAFKQK